MATNPQDPKPFNEYIKSYDIHTYYDVDKPSSRAAALALRTKLLEDFAAEVSSGELEVFHMWDKPVGPHPTAMWECQFSSPEVFARLVPWYQYSHGDMSVLIHPHTGKGAVMDHTGHAMWLGEKMPLIMEPLYQEDKKREGKKV